jgi:hypothetical protein
MQGCHRYRPLLVHYHYDELDPVMQAEIETHLKLCPACQKALEQLVRLEHDIPRKPLIEPDEEVLKGLRNVVSLKLARQNRQKSQFWPPFTFIKPMPAFQVGFSFLLLAFGFLLGLQWPDQPQTQSLSLQDLLLTGQTIRSEAKIIAPYMANVEKLAINPQDGTIEITYNTVNDIQVKGTPQDPTVQQVLQYAMLDDSSPSNRLNAIKAVNYIAEQDQNITPELASGLERLLQTEKNPGIRLMAVKALKQLPLTDSLKELFVRILLHDDYAPMRMEAIDALSQVPLDKSSEAVLQAAKQDTSAYISNRAEKLLKTLATTPQSVKIEREE